MNSQELQQRTKDFALRIINLFQNLPPRTDAQVLGKQLLRCGTSVGANYRAACHAKSAADFLAKMKICEEEADECEFWLELLAEGGIVKPALLEPLHREAQELASIMAASARTSRTRQRASSSNRQS
ncbi:MAG: four helix bundle protein [Akkermansia sp.]|nr:four helix bundle protein [Akkermansia sp.]